MRQKIVKSPKHVPLKRIRIRFVAVSTLLFLCFLLLGARAFELHLTDNSKLSRLAKNQYKKRVVVAPKRGNIFDTHGETLAIDIKVDSIYAMPHRIKEDQKFAQALAKALNIPQKKILKRIANKKKKFVWIKRRIDKEEALKVKELKIKGVGSLPEYKRFYPNGQLAANLLGAVGYDAKALSGLELRFDKTLRSEDPPILVEQDAKGRSYAPFELVGLEHPNQIVLTIDKTIQYLAERELHSAVTKAKAKGGVAIVLEVKSGKILAMANAPSFDPNQYYNYDFKMWRNRAVTDVFEPGSTFKAFTAAAALESKTIDQQKKIHCENGAMKVGKNIIHDTHGHGLLNLHDIIKFSSNICSYKLAQKIGKKKFYQFIRDFGFGSKTGIDAPGEQRGLLASQKNMSRIQLGTIGFGQGISVSPLQITMAYGALANGGYLMKPLLLQEVRDSNGKTLKKYGPEISKQVVSEATAQTTIKLLQSVVEKGGTGTRAALESHTVAGKTGTAQKVIEGHKGYAKGKYVASFIGLAPAENPHLVVLVSVDEPKGAYYGGTVSGPVFKKIMGQSLAYLKIPPSNPNGRSFQTTRVAAKTKHGVPKIKKPVVKEKKSNEKATKPDKKNVRQEETAHEDVEKDTETTRPIPDLTGLSVREALRKGHSQEFRVEIQGSGICSHQEPSPGNTAVLGTAIILECEPPI